MSPQVLRSTKSNERNLTEDSSFNSPEQEELDNTLTEMPRERESTSIAWSGGQEMDGGHDSQGITELITRRLEDLEKRVKKMMEEEKKRLEKLETDKERNLQKN